MKLSKRVLSIIVLIMILLSTSLMVSASEGDTSSGTGSGWIGGGTPIPAGQPTTWGNSTGYRIYLTKDSLYYDNGAITQSSLYWLEMYKNTAIYEFSGVSNAGVSPTSSNYSNSVNGGRGLKYYGFNSGSYGQGTVSPAQIMSAGAGNNNGTADFNQLVGDGKGTIAMWRYRDGAVNLTSLATWANNTFGAASLTPAFLDSFCTNYVNMNINAGNTTSNLPHNATEFVNGHWLIIVEPVFLIANMGTGNACLALSYQDYYGRNKDVVAGNYGYKYRVWSNFNTTAGYMGLIYTNFTSAKWGNISTAQSGPLAGFGLYGSTTSEDTPTETYRANTNVILRYDGPVKSNLSGAAATIDTSTVLNNYNTSALNRSYAGAMTGTLNPADLDNFDTNSINGTAIQSSGNAINTLGTDTIISGDALPKFANVANTSLADYAISSFGTYSVTLQATSEHELNTLLSDLASATMSSYVVDPGALSTFNFGNCYSMRTDQSLSAYASTTASGESPTAISEINYGASASLDQRTSNVELIIANMASYGLQQSKILKVNVSNKTFTPNIVTEASRYSVTVQVLYQKTNVTSYFASTSVTDGVATALSNSNATYDVSVPYKATIDAPDLGTSMLIVFADNSAAGNYRLSVDPSGMNITNALSSITQDGFTPTSANDVRVKLASLGVVATVQFIPTNALEIALRASNDANGNLAGYDALVLTTRVTTPAPINNTYTLRDYELNYIFAYITDNPVYVVKDSTNKPITIGKNPTYAGSTISFSNGIAGSATNIFYNPINCIFDIEALNLKTFSPTASSPSIVPNHAVSLVRGSFGDSVVLSSMYPMSQDLVDYAKLHYGVGETNKGTLNALTNTVTLNNSSAVLKVMNDSFSWYSSRNAEHEAYSIGATTYYYYTGAFSNGSNSVTYNLTETAYKYVPVNRATIGVTTGLVPSSLVKAGEGLANYKSISLSSDTTKTLKFYPEVAMRAYYTTAVDTLGTVSPITLYTMGEKARALNPSGLYIITVSSGAGDLSTGSTTSDMLATGTAASALSDSMGSLGVAYAGSGYTVNASANVNVTLSGFMLDQVDKTLDTHAAGDPLNLISTWGKTYGNVVSDNVDIKTAWGSSANDTDTAYTAWADSVKDALTLTVSMKTTEKSGTAVKTYDGLVTEMGAISGGTTTTSLVYNIQVVNGAIVEDDAYTQLITSIASKYYNVASTAVTATQRASAVTMFKGSSMYSQIAAAIEDSKDTDNASQAGASLGSSSHWYDETVRTFVIREYTTTPISMSNCIASDKFDIDAGPSQDITSTDLFKKGYYAKFYVSVYLDKALVNMPSAVVYSPSADNFGAAVDGGTVLVNRLYIKGADIIIADATTSDAKN